MRSKRILLSLCALFCSLLCGCSYLSSALGTGQVLDAGRVVNAGFVLEGTEIHITEAEPIAAFANLVNSGRPVQVDTLHIPTPSVTVTVENGDGSTSVFGIYDFTKDARYAYILTPDNGYLEVDRASLLGLLSSEDFAPLYAHKQFPIATISADEKQGTLIPDSGDWSYKRLDGRYYESTASMAEQDYKYVLSSPNAPVITFSIEPDTTSVVVTREGKTMFEGTLDELASFRMSGSGRYDYEVTAIWSKATLSDCFGNAIYRFCVDYAPKASFEISASTLDPGEALVIYAVGLDEDEEITVNSPFKFEPEFFNYEGRRVCIFPLSYNNKPGTYTMELSAKSAYAKYEITLSDKQFDIQELTVDKKITESTVDDDEANAEFERIITPLKAVRDEEKYFDGPFIMPATAKITTEFGAIRSVNGNETTTRHSGIDIAAKRGTTVKASGNGRVLYAGKLKLTGNTVLIEHGFGLKTWYYHMDSLKVKTDDMVKQGDPIGTVGSTGFSTGPHLHFGMSVNGVFINPNTAIDQALID